MEDVRGYKVTYTGPEVQDLFDDVANASALSNLEIQAIIDSVV